MTEKKNDAESKKIMKTISKTDHTLQLALREELYSEEVLHKCFYGYRYADYIIGIDKVHSLYTVVITAKTKTKIDHDALLLKIKNDLIDLKLRDMLAK